MSPFPPRSSRPAPELAAGRIHLWSLRLDPPADIRKEGSAYDLPMALSVLQASGQITTEGLENYVIMGELALDGTLRPIKGVLLYGNVAGLGITVQSQEISGTTYVGSGTITEESFPIE